MTATPASSGRKAVGSNDVFAATFRRCLDDVVADVLKRVRVCAAEDCKVIFMKKHRTKFCSRRCQWRVGKRSSRKTSR